MERTSGEEDLVKCEIEDHPVVNNVGFLTGSGKNKVVVYANLRCYAACLNGDCSVQQVGIRMSTKRPTQLDCLSELHSRIQQHHGDKCVDAAQSWQVASSAVTSTKLPVDEGAASRNANDVLMLRTKLKSIEEYCHHE